MTPAEYITAFNQYKRSLSSLSFVDKEDRKLEFYFESLLDCSLLYSFEDIKKWYKAIVARKEMSIEEIPLGDCRQWIVDRNTIRHESGEFFTVKGLRVKTQIREATKGWDQPIIQQTGFDGGILGILRKRFNGVPHYLMEAKSEPGNPNLVQISPTLQATYSNINLAHSGKAPHYLHFFHNVTEPHHVHLKQWFSEDGGRLYNKRNLNMIVEIPEDREVTLVNNNFIWMSLYQIKEGLKENAWVANSVRSILAAI